MGLPHVFPVTLRTQDKPVSADLHVDQYYTQSTSKCLVPSRSLFPCLTVCWCSGLQLRPRPREASSSQRRPRGKFSRPPLLLLDQEVEQRVAALYQSALMLVT